MNTENLSTLIIHKLTQDQYNRVVEEGEIDENALYLTPDEVEIPQSDWNQNDETAQDFIKNRPFYTQETATVIYEKSSGLSEYSNVIQPIENDPSDCFHNAGVYRFTVNETLVFDYYKETTTPHGTQNQLIFINTPHNIVISEFQPKPDFGSMSFPPKMENRQPISQIPDSLKIEYIESQIKKIDEQYLPKLVGQNVEGVEYTIDGTTVVAGIGAEIFNIDSNNNKASGKYSHAEGYYTVASGDWSHAENYYTVASGEYSHAEGAGTKAFDNGSHAEGMATIASGSAAHAEGAATQATNGSAHAEGSETIASGTTSHAEGKGTIADSEYQHAQGKWNIEDSDGIYSHIVGNGESDTKRSNAHTLDWQGNAWFAGDVYVGSTSGTNKDEGSVKLQKSITGTAGQVVGFDANGNAVAQNNPQSDWNQNDETAIDYIKNRPFYIEEEENTETILINNQTISGFYSIYDWYLADEDLTESFKFDIVDGKKYVVNWDGIEYEVIGCACDGFNYIGNANYTNIGMSTGGNIPFSIINYIDSEDIENSYMVIVTTETEESHTISVTEYPSSKINKINPEFLPEGYPYKLIINDGALLFNCQGSRLPSWFNSSFGEFVDGKKYTVVLDGVTYSNIIAHVNDSNIITIGDDNTPFTIEAGHHYLTPESYMLCIRTNSEIVDTETTHDIAIYGAAKIIKTIDIDYLPKNLHNPIGLPGTGEYSEIFNTPVNDATGDYSHAEGMSTEAIGFASHAEGRYSNAVGSCSHAEGYKSNAAGSYSHVEGYYSNAIGNYSHAEGYNRRDSLKASGEANSVIYTVYSYPDSLSMGSVIYYNDTYAKVEEIDFDSDTIKLSKTLDSNNALNNKYIYVYGATAFGNYSHVEGYNAVATGDYSHAEGNNTVASGNSAHAEGYHTLASGSESHAEGAYSTASGNYSHAEGWKTEAAGNYSHAEGYQTTATGDYSHSEGYNVIANSKLQHVQGEFNIEDTTGDSSTRGTYAHIVGNGVDYGNRSNAHTLDWDGNAWFAGDVYVSSTSGKNKDAGSKKLVTIDEVNAAITAAIGQVIGGSY